MVRSLPGFDVTTGFRPTVAFTCLVNRDHVEVTFDSPKVRIAEVVFVDHKETSGSFEDSTRTSLRLWRALGRCRVHTARSGSIQLTWGAEQLVGVVSGSAFCCARARAAWI